MPYIPYTRCAAWDSFSKTRDDNIQEMMINDETVLLALRHNSKICCDIAVGCCDAATPPPAASGGEIN